MVSRRRSSSIWLAAAALCALAFGCGKEEPDLENGKRLYTGQLAEGQKAPDGYQPCGACHALARAGTSGTAGPDLDEAFATARRDGMNAETVQGVVHDQILHPRRNSTMPPKLVEGDDARDVAAYVAEVAGQPGKDTGALANAGRPKVSTKPVVAKGGTLKIDADPTGALAFVTSKAEAKPGPLMFVSVNKATIPHNIALRDPAGKLVKEGPDVSGGGSSKFSASVKAGKYEFVCTVPGHEEGGMKGDLTVK